ncbi:MAG: 4-phosphoerythronate dehydrogenase [Mangrovibacterium sp.]
MRIVIDDKIPYIQGVLEPFAEVIYKNGGKINHSDLINTDAIIIRTRTICNAELLEGTSVKFIATATIGFDHIDTDYCKNAGIFWTNAPGCNSGSVLQYIASALVYIANSSKLNLCDKTIGIVGVGNVGKKIAAFCHTIGMKVLLNDPPREEIEGKTNFVDIETIQKKADIITFHVPLIENGDNATSHLVNDEFITKCKPSVFFINSCRGEIIDNKSLAQAISQNKINGAVVDCWENEPLIDDYLLELSLLTTPHIAGYSRDGKANGTSMSVQALSKFFNIGINEWTCQSIEDAQTKMIIIDGLNKSAFEILSEAINSTYQIEIDSYRLKSNKLLFEELRGNYPVRREFPYYNILASNISKKTAELLSNIGFNVEF